MEGGGSIKELRSTFGGVVVEEGPAKQLIEHPQEERTKQFLAHYSE